MAPDELGPAADAGVMPRSARARDTRAVDGQIASLEALVAGRVTIAGDVIELDPHTWALHGSIAVDGEVLLAEYASELEARLALEQLGRRIGR